MTPLWRSLLPNSANALNPPKHSGDHWISKPSTNPLTRWIKLKNQAPRLPKSTPTSFPRLKRSFSELPILPKSSQFFYISHVLFSELLKISLPAMKWQISSEAFELGWRWRSNRRWFGWQGKEWREVTGDFYLRVCRYEKCLESEDNGVAGPGWFRGSSRPSWNHSSLTSLSLGLSPLSHYPFRLPGL